MVVDLDARNEVVGIELIQPTRTTLQEVARRYDLPEFSLADLEIVSPEDYQSRYHKQENPTLIAIWY